MKVFLGDIEIRYNDKLSLKDAQKEPIIQYDNKNKLYTVIMIDRDTPSKENAYNKYWLHLLKVNNNIDIMSYEAPNPAVGTGYHRYYFLLFEQPNYIDISSYKINKRRAFNLDDFVGRFNLHLEDKIKFQTKNPHMENI
jgi:phosphatidylethanolamine-binding protein (PEBP) family uncharacterized protein